MARLIQPPSLEPYRLEKRSEVDAATLELQALLRSVVGRKVGLIGIVQLECCVFSTLLPSSPEFLTLLFASAERPTEH